MKFHCGQGVDRVVVWMSRLLLVFVLAVDRAMKIWLGAREW